MSRSEDMQRDITRIALEGADNNGFALAGSGAIREHGLIARPTADVDLFTVMSAQEKFSGAVDEMLQRLRAAGYTVQVDQRSDAFARLEVSARGLETSIDLGIDWRSREPVQLEVGPVLAVEDAVANKVAALYSRAEARDYLDVDAIRSSGRYSDAQLIALGENADPGFDRSMFAERLEMSEHLQPREVSIYGVSPQALDEIKGRSQKWARTVRNERTQKAVREKVQKNLQERKGQQLPRDPGIDPPSRSGPKL